MLSEGDPLILSEGLSLGDPLIDSEGDAEGEPEMDSDGLPLGEPLGDPLGLLEGEVLGLCSGTHSTPSWLTHATPLLSTQRIAIYLAPLLYSDLLTRCIIEATLHITRSPRWLPPYRLHHIHTHLYRKLCLVA